MPLQPFDPPAGIFRDGTDYSAKGRWYDGDKIRFRGGKAERIGGWSKLTSSAFTGVCRHLIQWTDLSNVRHIGAGTNSKFYVENSGGVLFDKTPLRSMALPNDPFGTTIGTPTLTVNHRAHGMAAGDRVLIDGAAAVGGFAAAALNKVHTIATTAANSYTITMSTNASATATGGGALVTVLYSKDFYVPLPNNPFTTTNGSSTVSVSHPNHGAQAGDYVTFTGAAAVGGLTVTGEIMIQSISSADVYTINMGSAATSGAVGGGASVSAQYEINAGNADYTVGTGWGAGGWGSGGWGASTSGTAFGQQIRVWSSDVFGEDLIINPRGGGIFYYDQSSGATPLDHRLLSGAASPPAQANFVMVSPEDRRVFAFGCTDINTGVLDPMLVRWTDAENPADWSPTPDNTSGFIRLSTGSEIKCAAKAKSEILVWTESSLTSMRFVDEFVYGAQLLSPNIDILGPNSVKVVDDMVFWMGRENFFLYNGRVQVLPCTVRQYVFNDINLNQAYKVTTATNRLYREVWWFYPSEDSSENDRYVVFNYAENVWYFGSLARTAWSDVGITNYPIAASPDGYVYYHEIGWDDGSVNPPVPIEAYVESAAFELGEGDRFSFVRRVIPDVTFDDSESAVPSVTYTLKPRNYPGGPYRDPHQGVTTRTSVGVVEQWTTKLDLRLRGRQFVLRISSEDLGVGWRLGVNRFDVQPDGRK